MSEVTIIHADALDALRGMPDRSVHAVVTDPPYGLGDMGAKVVTSTFQRWLSGDREYTPSRKGFMGNDWDSFVPPPALWDEVFRVLKPGGFLVSFSGGRTQDLMGLSIRLAGFEIRDPIAWIYSKSFPKGATVSDSLRRAGVNDAEASVWDGWNSTMKSNHEPIIMARKPLEGTVVENVRAHGTGALNLDACRTPFADEADAEETRAKNQHTDFGTAQGGNAVYGSYNREGATKKNYDASRGRLPANVVLDDASADALDAVYPRAARFFPRMPADDLPVFYADKAPVSERPIVDGVKHDTVKPLSVMRWLVRLVTPIGGVVLDPHGGSGTTGEAALLEGFDSIVIEREEGYIPLIRERVRRSSPTMMGT